MTAVSGILARGESCTKLAGGLGILEAPLTAPGGMVYYSDVLLGGVYRLSPDGACVKVIPHRKGIGGLAMDVAGEMIVTGRNVARKRSDGSTEVLLERDEVAGVGSFNDLVVDRRGRVYVGALNLVPPVPTGRPAQTGLHLIDLDGTSKVVARDLLFPNGAAISPDGTRLYLADSAARCIYRFTVRADGSLEERRTVVGWDAGAPDGLVLCEGGLLFVAVNGERASIEIITEEGRCLQEVALPTRLVTNVCFGGPDGRNLYITTGSAEDETGRGELYGLRCVVRGAPVWRSRVRLRCKSEVRESEG